MDFAGRKPPCLLSANVRRRSAGRVTESSLTVERCLARGVCRAELLSWERNRHVGQSSGWVIEQHPLFYRRRPHHRGADHRLVYVRKGRRACSDARRYRGTGHGANSGARARTCSGACPRARTGSDPRARAGSGPRACTGSGARTDHALSSVGKHSGGRRSRGVPFLCFKSTAGLRWLRPAC